MKGHSKNVTTIRWHPHASNVLASTSIDGTVRVWDVENQKSLICFEDPKD